jgi:hypothetical protein
LLLLDPIFHVAAWAVFLFVNRCRRELLGREAGDHEPWVFTLGQVRVITVNDGIAITINAGMWLAGLQVTTA